MKKTAAKSLAHRFHKHRGDSGDLAAQLAPLEELSEPPEARTNGSQLVAQENGAIVVGADQPELAKEIAGAEGRNGALGVEPVVIVIIGLLLAFIAFIAWQISRMPSQ